jgi:hypothetical protein
LRTHSSPSRTACNCIAVTDGELDLGVEDLWQELGLELLAAVAKDRLAHDADALADLRSAAAGERLVEQVLVDAVTFLATVLLRPGDSHPAALGDLLHEGAALRSVDDLGHVLAGRVEDLGVLVGVEKGFDLGEKGLLLGGEIKVHEATLMKI